MRITTSEDYYGERHCPLDECNRNYCKPHRLLWRDHETAELTHDGAGQPWFELKDCPICDQEARQRRFSNVA